ncbi:hypothetical protein M011DRAFT_465370 [Sporormia fimetaria CBS 119925]|uniref:F-box domain-containing protein n=1 Tax=Sporormia fimetaria CBS 119925 TaxID=1340428 RepID=A0A6A6VKN9_9PLEO|nr:hypothetical protein M011DRAFT_465370 [Sporormia fimetaria CBS 119925]
MAADTSSRSWLSRLRHIGKRPEERRGRVQDTPRRLQRRHVPENSQEVVDRQAGINELGEYEHSIFSDATTLVGERPRDHTEMLHGLAHHDSFDSIVDVARGQAGEHDDVQRVAHQRSEKHERMIASLPSSIWQIIASYLDYASAASLAISSKTLLEKVTSEPLQHLHQPLNRPQLIRFLNLLDADLPWHLLCFPCAKYHFRNNPGREKLHTDFVNHPVFTCPKVYSSTLPRIRLTHNRELPYAFIQLAIRYTLHSPLHGIPPETLCRRWTDSGWQHQTRYMVHEGHLLVRIRSQIFAPPNLTETGERHLLYERQNYTPFFSVCAHWRDGELMRLCKCALSHVPPPPQSYLRQLRAAPSVNRSLAHPGMLARQCDDCRPARRCPECPSEYLIEVNLVEDRNDARMRFKHALVVTRWCDLGDGKSPSASPEFCAIKGEKADYDSFSNVGRRAVAGVFESKMSGAIPGQRMISLNPKNVKSGEQGHGWY